MPRVNAFSLRDSPSAELGAYTYFSTAGELWRTDHTADGTSRFADILPGWRGSNPSSLKTIGSYLFFFASDGVHGRELWKSDGTLAGTAMVKDVDPMPDASFGFSPTILGYLNNKPFYIARNASESHYLWKSDGTAAGTEMVKDLGLVDTAGQPQYSEYLGATASNGILYILRTRTTDNTTKFWRTNGTASGTLEVTSAQIKALQAIGNTCYYATPTALFSTTTGTSSTLLGNIGVGANLTTALNGKLYFASGYQSTELWTSNGTSAGTVKVASMGSSIAAIATMGSNLVILTTDKKLWVSDGDGGGTTQAIHTFPSNATLYTDTDFQNDLIQVAGTQAFFRVYYSSTYTLELWRTDGSALGTEVIQTVVGNSPSSSGFSTTYLTSAGNRLLHSWVDPVYGTNVFSNSGTPDEAIDLTSQGQVSPTQQETAFVVMGNQVIFAVNDGTHGFELWRSEGTPESTGLLRDIDDSNVHDHVFFGSPRNLAAAEGTLYFEAHDSVHGYALWRSDGSTAGTTFVKDFHPSTNNYLGGSSLKAALGNRVVTLGSSDSKNALWISDGTEEGNTILLDDGVYPYLLSAGERVFFSYASGYSGSPYGYEPWVTDGTPAGTTLLKDINPGAASSTSSSTLPLYSGGKIYFSANDGTNGLEPWVSDGSTGGTVLLKDVSPGAASSSPAYLDAADGKVYFTATTPAEGKELWRTDPLDGAVLVKDLVPGTESSTIRAAVGLGDQLVFLTSASSTTGVALWTSDGTPTGTVKIADWPTALYSSTMAKLVRLGNYAFFVGPFQDFGTALWVTDGTVGGTRVVTETEPSLSKSVNISTAFSNSLLYRVDDNSTRERQYRRVSLPPLQLDLATAPVGVGTVYGSGTFAEGALAPIVARPAPGYVFQGWEGSGVEQAGSYSTTVDISADTSLVARFGPAPVADFAEWLDLFLSPEEAEDPVLGGPEGDRDADGVRNGVEYVLRLNPLSFQAPGSLGEYAYWEEGAHDWLSLEFTLPIEITSDTTISIWQSPDLANWTRLAVKTGNGAWQIENGGQVDESVQPDSSTAVRVISTLDRAAGADGYLQLRTAIAP